MAEHNNGLISNCTLEDIVVLGGVSKGGLVHYNRKGGEIEGCCAKSIKMKGNYDTSEGWFGCIAHKNSGHIRFCETSEIGTEEQDIGGIVVRNENTIRDCMVEVTDPISSSSISILNRGNIKKCVWLGNRNPMRLTKTNEGRVEKMKRIHDEKEIRRRRITEKI